MQKQGKFYCLANSKQYTKFKKKQRTSFFNLFRTLWTLEFSLKICFFHIMAPNFIKKNPEKTNVLRLKRTGNRLTAGQLDRKQKGR